MKNEKLEPGDLAFILKSFSGQSVGKIVTCIQMDGEHTLYGRMWLVESSFPMRVVGGDVVRKAHLPEKWLKKIPKDPLPDEETEEPTELEDAEQLTA